MRLLLITNIFPNPIQRGKGSFNLEMVRALGQLWDEIEVVSPVSWVDEWRARRKGHYMGPHRHEAVDGIRVHYAPYYYTPKVLRTHYGQFMWHSIRDVLLQVTEAKPPDIVLSYWVHPDGEVALRLARQIDKPCVVVVGGSDILLLCKRRSRCRCIVRVLNAVDMIVAVSRNLRDKVLDLGVAPGKTHVCWRGVNTKKFRAGDRSKARQRLGLPASVPLLLWIGRMVPVKNLETLLGAAAILKERGGDFRLLLVGTGPLEDYLRRKCRARGLQDRVSFMGPIMHDALPDWYRAADLTVLPSWSEGIPNVLLESMATGVPFVASNVGGIPEIAVKDSDLLLPPDDPHAWADAIAQQLSRSNAPAIPCASRSRGRIPRRI